ncbi:MAG: hypothetical protein C4523_02230 [Myxococcales bacterium]|nr:MAG: hypothetical protein C4523_02230 [Myxococcales bacterium]
MNQIGTVVRLDGPLAIVESCRQNACEECREGSCETGSAFFLRALNNVGAKPGAQVEVRLSSGRMLGSVLLVFWLPLILGGLGYLAGEAIGERLFGAANAWLAAASALTGVAVAIVFIILAERRAAASGRGCEVVRIIDPAPSLPIRSSSIASGRPGSSDS